MSVYRTPLTRAEFIKVLAAKHGAVDRAVRYAGFDADAAFAIECADVAEEVATLVVLASRTVDPWDVEADPADWPADTDDDVWATTDPEPAVGPLPTEAFLPPDYEPSAADRREWAIISDREARVDHALDRLADEAAALDLMTRGLIHCPAPISGGSPADSKPVRVRWDDDGTRSRRQPIIRDEDVIASQGGCG